MGNKFFKLFNNAKSDKNATLTEREELKNIEDAFNNQEFKMYLQFIVDNKHKKLASAEALSRWEKPSGEIAYPGSYIGLMEKSGLISRFDFYMFERVCKKLAEWKGTDLDNLTISCNFTRITISEKDFVAQIKNIADKYDFDRKKLLIEITEDSIEKNLIAAMYNIVKVKELGFHIALDDIGSGYTSLISLCEYPIDVVKLDREILLLASTEKGKKLFWGIISLVHYLNLRVVCEGVENEEQNKFVSDSDCDYIQGWFYHKAIPENKAEDFARGYVNAVI